MSQRRSLFTLGVFLAAFTLLASGANAQLQKIAVTKAATTYDSVTVTWTFAHPQALGHVDSAGLGFNLYYVKGDSLAQLTTGRQIGAAMMMDVALGDSAGRKASTEPMGTDFSFKLKMGLEPATKYVFSLRSYKGEPAILDPVLPMAPVAALAVTLAAPVPSSPRDVEVMSGDKKLMVSWQPPVRAAGGSTTIKLDRYEVRWRWSQTADHDAGDWTMHPTALAPATTKLTATMYEITGLDNDIVYDVQVQAINAAKGKSGWYPALPGVRATPTAGGTPTPALPLFGALTLGAGLFAAGRARLRRRAQRQLTR